MTRGVGKKTARGAAALPSRLRIIGGRWRGSRLAIPPLDAIRPSPDRVRETLFNWLQQQVVGARCLDLFAGSGALGIEALSRGAAHVTFVDREPQVARHLAQTLERLGGAGDARIVADEALTFLRSGPQPFDIVFLDPPYASGVLAAVCTALAGGWLAPQAYIYIESPAGQPLPALPPDWRVHRSKRAGQVGYHLLHASAAATEVST